MKEGDEDVALNLLWTPRKMDTFSSVFQTILQYVPAQFVENGLERAYKARFSKR